MTNFKKLDRKPLSESVAEQIESAIYDGTFAVGHQLPSEQQLALQFGVSRNIVREAYKYLKERGLIDIQNGMGAYVSQPTTDRTSNALGRYIRMLDQDDIIANLYEVRRLIEGESARLAAVRATEEDLDHLQSCIKRMEEHAGSVEAWTDADLDFHLSLAKASGNSLFPVLLQPLVDYLRGVIMEGYTELGAIERGLQAHRNVYLCVKARDAEGAHRTILEHLRDSEGRVERLSNSRKVL